MRFSQRQNHSSLKEILSKAFSFSGLFSGILSGTFLVCFFFVSIFLSHGAEAATSSEHSAIPAQNHIPQDNPSQTSSSQPPISQKPGNNKEAHLQPSFPSDTLHPDAHHPDSSAGSSQFPPLKPEKSSAQQKYSTQFSAGLGFPALLQAGVHFPSKLAENYQKVFSITAGSVFWISELLVMEEIQKHWESIFAGAGIYQILRLSWPSPDFKNDNEWSAGLGIHFSAGRGPFTLKGGIAQNRTWIPVGGEHLGLWEKSFFLSLHFQAEVK